MKRLKVHLLVGVCSLALLCTYLLFSLVFGRTSSTEETSAPVAGGELPQDASDARPTTPTDALGGSVDTSGGLQENEYLDIQDLYVACPTLDHLTHGCRAALDRRYLDQLAHEPLVPLSDPPTWRRLFENAATNRSTVESTLKSDDCAIADGEAKFELSHSCGADAIADFALLYGNCVAKRYEYEQAAGQENLDRRLDEIALEFDNDLYWKKRLETEDQRFRAAWMLDRCGDLEDVTSPIPELEITWSDMRTDELAWFPLSITPVEAKPYPTVIDDVWDYPLYPSTVEEALTEWSAKLGSELGISRFVGDAEYNRALMARYPATAHVHRAQQQVDGLRRKFLRDSDAAWKRMYPSDHEGEGHTLISQLPPEYEQFRSALLTRLRQDELQVRGYHARFVLVEAGRAGIELDEADVRAWVSGSGNE